MVRLLTEASLVSSTPMPSSPETQDILFRVWVRQLDTEGIDPRFWVQSFGRAINERASLTAAFQPAEVVKAWRKYGEGWARQQIFAITPEELGASSAAEYAEAQAALRQMWMPRFTVAEK